MSSVSSRTTPGASNVKELVQHAAGLVIAQNASLSRATQCLNTRQDLAGGGRQLGALTIQDSQGLLAHQVSKVGGLRKPKQHKANSSEVNNWFGDLPLLQVKMNYGAVSTSTNRNQPTNKEQPQHPGHGSTIYHIMCQLPQNRVVKRGVLSNGFLTFALFLASTKSFTGMSKTLALGLSSWKNQPFGGWLLLSQEKCMALHAVDFQRLTQ